MQNIKDNVSSFYSRFAKATLRRKIIIVVVLLMAIGFLAYSLLGRQQKQPQYQTAQATKGILVTSVTASGTVSSGNSVAVTTSATGVVSQVYAKQGDSVTQGEKLADITLDQDSQQRQASAWSTYLSAENALNAAQAKMNSLQSALFKANQTFVNDAGTSNPDTSDPKYIEEKADWQQAESDYNNQSGVINQAQAAVASAWMSYQQISATITSPADGTLISFTLAPGLPISSTGSSSSNSNSSNANLSASNENTGSSSSLGTITLPGGQLQATVNLSEIDVTKAHPGQKVTMTLDAFPNKTFTGRVSSIDTTGSVSSGVTTYPTTIIFDTDPGNIYPNMAVNATIITNIKDNVLLVPTTAVQTVNGQQTVRVLKNGQVQAVDVTTGDSSDTQTEITSGLSEDETVIIGTTASTSGTASPFGGGFGGGAVIRGGGFGGGARGFGGGGNVRVINRGG